MRRVLVTLAVSVVVVATFALWGTRPAAPSFSQVRAAHGPSDARLLDRRGALLDARRIDSRECGRESFALVGWTVLSRSGSRTNKVTS